jgi:SAM-dependent methyltransferase
MSTQVNFKMVDLIKHFLKKTLRPRGQRAFLSSIKIDKCRILDVGCGNASSVFLKTVKPDCVAYGIDVGDFNQSDKSKGLYQQYIISKPEMFSQAIQNIPEDFDVVISNHNIEHCDDPEGTFRAMVNRTKVGGSLFVATPSLSSVGFPSRGGGLNFYDDPTHRHPVDLMKLFESESDRLECNFYAESSKPFVWWVLGCALEPTSRRKNHIRLGTWDYHGFEQIMWIKKKETK